MGRHKKIEKEILQPKKPLGVKNMYDWVSDGDELSQKFTSSLQRYLSIYGLHPVVHSELESKEVYERMYESAPDMLSTLSQLDLNGKAMVLRPELRASLLRAYIEKKISETQPFSKWYSLGNTYSLDAKNKTVSNVHLAVEVFGMFNHMAEVLVLSGFWYLLKDLGFSNITLEVNNLGDTQCQLAYSNQLKDFLAVRRFDLCENCLEVYTKRPFEVLKCTNFECQTVVAEAPMIFDFLDEATNKSFTSTLEALDELNIPYQLNHLYVSEEGVGHTTFAIKDKNGTILCSGGYHEEFLRILGGKSLRAFGFEASVTNLLEAMRAAEHVVESKEKYEVFLVPLGELAAKRSLRLFKELLAAEIAVYNNFGTEGVKNQLKAAEVNKAPVALIMGQKEAIDEMVILRDVKSGMQEMFHYENIVSEVMKRLGK